MELIARVKEGAAYIEERIRVTPRLGVVLGSGLGALGERVEEPVVIPYGDIPHFHGSTVQGHRGRLVTGLLQGCPVMVLQGRLHYYEGLSMDEVVFPVRCMKMLGVDNLIVTNAAGSDGETAPAGLVQDGLVEGMAPGVLVALADVLRRHRGRRSALLPQHRGQDSSVRR